MPASPPHSSLYLVGSRTASTARLLSGDPHFAFKSEDDITIITTKPRDYLLWQCHCQWYWSTAAVICRWGKILKKRIAPVKVCSREANLSLDQNHHIHFTGIIVTGCTCWEARYRCWARRRWGVDKQAWATTSCLLQLPPSLKKHLAPLLTSPGHRFVGEY